MTLVILTLPFDFITFLGIGWGGGHGVGRKFTIRSATLFPLGTGRGVAMGGYGVGHKHRRAEIESSVSMEGRTVASSIQTGVGRLAVFSD